MKRIQKYLKWIATYLTIYGIFGFSLFIEEESIQSLQFGGWQLEKVGDYQGILINSDIMTGFNKAMTITNIAGGWLNPIGYIAYRHYSVATERYIYALRRTVMANDPELMVGRVFDFSFKYNTYQQIEGGRYELRRGHVTVIIDNEPTDNPHSVHGLITQGRGNSIIVNDGVMKSL